MDNRVLDEVNKKINELLANTPAADVQKNLRALLQSTVLALIEEQFFDVSGQTFTSHPYRHSITLNSTRRSSASPASSVPEPIRFCR